MVYLQLDDLVVQNPHCAVQPDDLYLQPKDLYLQDPRCAVQPDDLYLQSEDLYLQDPRCAASNFQCDRSAICSVNWRE
jgi:hypothetical protein